MKKKKLQERLLKAIPGGAHTYSRGYDQFPYNAPEVLERGKGSYVYDNDGNKYLDYGMALRAVNIGYSEKVINEAAVKQIRLGNNLTRPSNIELEAAELIIKEIDSVDMVKFTKNGSTAVSAAVKLARSYTGRDMIARCSQHPFFSYDDWFIGSTDVKKGIPKSIQKLTKNFSYNDINSLEKLIKLYPKKIACVVLEPATHICPSTDKSRKDCCGKIKCDRSFRFSKNNYLMQVQRLCTKHGIVFILDEMITGFRWHMKGAQYLYGVDPDLSTFGKAMANGFSVSCVAGKRKIMELGSIEKSGQERTFLLSTTHGAEMCGLGAFVETVKFMKQNSVIEHMWKYGYDLKKLMTNLANDFDLSKNITIEGPSCSPIYTMKDNNGNISLPLKTLFSQEMIKNGVLMPWITLCYRHGPKELKKTEKALKKVFPIIKKALDGNIKNYLVGDIIKPVFRRYN
jgi:glutamate-1-semialdehyde 2,1-aminomutase